MFKRLTPGARDVIVEAQRRAVRGGHECVGCEHLLLAVAGSATPAGAVLLDAEVTPAAVERAIGALVGTPGGDSDDKVALRGLGIDLDQVRAVVEDAFGPGALGTLSTSPRRGGRLRRGRRRRPPCPKPTSDPPLSRRAKRCLELAFRESLRVGDHHVGVEHIAGSLLALDDTLAWRVLLHLGISPGELGRALQEAMRDGE